MSETIGETRSGFLVKGKGTRAWVIALIALIAVVIVFHYLCRGKYRWERKFGIVREGVLLRGRQPTASRIEWLRRRHGVKTIISLVYWSDMKTYPECKAEKETTAKYGIRFLHMPLGIPSPEQIEQFLAIVDDPKKRPVFIHCVAGTVRTGLLAAVFRMERDGWTNQQALDEMASYGFDTSNREHQEMIDFVLGYRRVQGLKSTSACLSNARCTGMEVKR